MKSQTFIGAALACLLAASITVPANAVTNTPPVTPANEDSSDIAPIPLYKSEFEEEHDTKEDTAAALTPQTRQQPVAANPAPPAAATAPVTTTNATTEEPPPAPKAVNVNLNWKWAATTDTKDLPSFVFKNILQVEYSSKNLSGAQGRVDVFRVYDNASPKLMKQFDVRQRDRNSLVTQILEFSERPPAATKKITFYATYTPTTEHALTPESVLKTPTLAFDYKLFPSKVTSTDLIGNPATINRGVKTKTVTLKASVSRAENPRAASLQVWSPTQKTWSTLQSVQVPGLGDAYKGKPASVMHAVTFKPVNLSIGGSKYRLYLNAAGSQSELITAGTMHVGNKAAQSATGSMQWKVLAPWRLNSIRLDVYAAKGATISVQHLDGKTWKTFKTYKHVTQKITLATPTGTVNTRGAVKQYRVLIGETATHAAGSSPIIKATWENPRHYSGNQLRTYNALKDKCPTMLIRNAKPHRVMYADVIPDTQVVTVYGVIPQKHLRTAALHECGHVKQYEAYKNKGGWSALQKRANQLYGTSGGLGAEQSADCIANVWFRNQYWPYKGSGKCNGARLAHAKAIIAGKTY